MVHLQPWPSNFTFSIFQGDLLEENKYDISWDTKWLIRQKNQLNLTVFQKLWKYIGVRLDPTKFEDRFKQHQQKKKMQAPHIGNN